MWYATETAFIDGKLFGTRCLFKEGDTSAVGHCYCSHNEEPMNEVKYEFGNRIEIHTDWFESEELAKSFCEGKITYKHIYDTYYKPSIRSTLSNFRKREIIEVKDGIEPYRGIYEKNPLDYEPYWAR